MDEKMKKNRKCEVCYQIKCAQCGWVPDEKQLELILKKIITVCILCGWIPGTPSSRL
jgi:hypothetical protein